MRTAVGPVVGHDPVKPRHVHERLTKSGQLGHLFAPRVRGRDEVDQRRRHRGDNGRCRRGCRGRGRGRRDPAVVAGRLPAVAMVILQHTEDAVLFWSRNTANSFMVWT